MKCHIIIICALTAIGFGTQAPAEDEVLLDTPPPPPNEASIKNKLAHLTVRKFLRFDKCGNSGNQRYFFEGNGDEIFSLETASTGQMTPLEIAMGGRQVYLMMYEGGILRLQPNSAEEKIVVGMINVASNRLDIHDKKSQMLLSSLTENIVSRQPVIDLQSFRKIQRPISESEQAGTGQPATRTESKSEGSDKPQPESEGRSR